MSDWILPMHRPLAFVLIAMTFAPTARAQAWQCRPPSTIPHVRVEGATAREPKRDIPIAGYTLALTWSPQICARASRAGDAFRCGDGGKRFGFTLHGLWPDGAGKTWPQYCRPAASLPPPVIRANICSTPSAQLIQHEWAKHGTCMTTRPSAYFDQSRKLYEKLNFPDMAILSRRRNLLVGDVVNAIAAANPGMRANMMRIRVARGGWLDEIWLCLDKRFRAVACKAGSSGARPALPIKIQLPQA
ncbi:MAG: ribonuclease T2 family protein [Sphingobium phenoxybenzoativorans]